MSASEQQADNQVAQMREALRSIARSRRISRVVSILAVVVGLCIVGEDFVLLGVPDRLVPILSFLGIGGHFDSIIRGVVDTRDLIYYASVIGFFLYLNVKSLEARR